MTDGATTDRQRSYLCNVTMAVTAGVLLMASGLATSICISAIERFYRNRGVQLPGCTELVLDMGHLGLGYLLCVVALCWTFKEVFRTYGSGHLKLNAAVQVASVFILIGIVYSIIAPFLYPEMGPLRQCWPDSD